LAYGNFFARLVLLLQMCDALRPRYRKEPEQMAPAVMGVMRGLLEPIGLISPTIHGLETGAMKDPIDDGQLSFALSLPGRVITMAVVRQELKVRCVAGEEIIVSGVDVSSLRKDLSTENIFIRVSTQAHLRHAL
jgi:hypothetical protein